VTAELRAYSFETAVTDRRYSYYAEISSMVQAGDRLSRDAQSIRRRE
jgi:hypothetical protein